MGRKVEKSFLTARQTEVLKLRGQGFTQEEIAEKLGTTRANVSILEKRARQNVEKARRTLELYEKISALVFVKVEPGTDLFDVPKLLYRKADEADLKIRLDSPTIVSFLKKKAGDKLAGRKVTKPTRIWVLADGGMVVE